MFSRNINDNNNTNNYTQMHSELGVWFASFQTDVPHSLPFGGVAGAGWRTESCHHVHHKGIYR